MVIIRREQVRTPLGACALALVQTGIGNWLIHCTFDFTAVPDPGTIFVMWLGYVAMSVVCTYRVHPRVKTAGMVTYIACFCASLTAWSEVTKFLCYYSPLNLSALFLHQRGMLMLFIVPFTTLLCLVTGSCLCGWLCARLVKGKVVVQDGTLCPGCGYSLIGNVEQRCPECAREFTYQELGTTREKLSAALNRAEE